MTEIADRLAHVLRHPDEAVTAETIHRSHHGAVFVSAGTTEHFHVEYQRHLGYAGQVLARGVLGECEADYAQLTEWFGGVVPPHLPFRVSIVRGSFGAFHDACTDTHLRCSAFDGHNAELVEMLNMAEAVEVFSAAQNAGWNCGESNGEGLSRVLATALHPTQLRRVRDGRRLAQLATRELRRPQRADRPRPGVDRLRGVVPQLPAPSASPSVGDDRRPRSTDPRGDLPRPPEHERRLGAVLHAARRALPARPARARDHRQRLPTLSPAGPKGPAQSPERHRPS